MLLKYMCSVTRHDVLYFILRDDFLAFLIGVLDELLDVSEPPCRCWKRYYVITDSLE